MRWLRVGWHSRGPSVTLLAAVAAAEYLLPGRPAARLAALVLGGALVIRFVAQSLRHFRLAARVPAVLRARMLEMALTAAAVLLLASKAAVWARELAAPAARSGLDPIYADYATGFLLVCALRLIAGDIPVRRVLQRLELRPAETVAVGFAGAILTGALLLSLPTSVTRLERLSLVDTLFTATSAVTTTGLAAYDPGTFHSAFGQVVLIALMQLGGLGTMGASASLVILAGRRLRLQSAAALRESMDLETVGHVRAELGRILAITIGAEAAGALLLYLRWRDRPDVEAPGFAAVFHAVSAFCTAGFSTFPSGLMSFRDDVVTNAIIGFLVLLGSLGAPVVWVLGRLVAPAWRRRRVPHLTLHARLALVATGILLGGGTLAALALERGGALAGLDGPRRAMAALFLAVTAQSTAGFSTVETAGLGAATLWVVMVLMFVGGSAGSTAGGIKTTTAAVIVSTLWATAKGRERVEAFRRTIPAEQVAKALALVGISLGTVAAAIIVLLASQEADSLALTFEAVSAFGTVGLSTGVTPALNDLGKGVIMVLMFVGRTGPLTLGFALAARSARSRVSYPTEKVILG